MNATICNFFPYGQFSLCDVGRDREKAHTNYSVVEIPEYLNKVCTDTGIDK